MLTQPMNQDLSLLQPYPFERLNALKKAVTPPESLTHIALSIGEPKHPAPHFVIEHLIAHNHLLSSYPSTRGTDTLREAIADWLTRRFQVTKVDPKTQVLPVNGTREALFAFAQCVVDRHSKQPPTVMMPNPFYQIYEGAALLAGAQPVFMNCTPQNQFIPDLDAITDAQWDACQLLYLCTPGNPTGAVMSADYLKKAIALAQKHDFVIASDECYSEIYFDHPPTGLLQAASEMGLDDYRRCVVFHSLSKRSNLPGLRSGFVAGDASILKQFLLYRTYHGCAMPPATQSASAVAWQDEQHVLENRQKYQQKFSRAMQLLQPLQPSMPEAAFYLWLKTPIDDTEFAQRLFAEQHVTVLPGQFLSRNAGGINPGKGYVRMALVAELDECCDALQRIVTFSNKLI